MIYSVNILNLPKTPREGYVVARTDESKLWYYGTYETEERAREVAVELGNGIVVYAKENL